MTKQKSWEEELNCHFLNWEGEFEEDAWRKIPKLKDFIRSILSTLLSEVEEKVVGEDQDWQWEDMGTIKDRASRNMLRQEQRQALNKLKERYIK